MSRIGVAIAGYGYWGPNLARNFSNAPDWDLRWILDARPSRLESARRQYSNIKLSSNIEEALSDPGVDAIAIATPASTHFDLAMRALRAGKHVLVEKPMTNTSAEAQALIEQAASQNLVLLVDHTFIYTPAVRRIRDLISTGELGDILYYDSVRINLGLFQHDVDVLWDLAVHDLSILNFLIDRPPTAVSAVGQSHVAGAPENVAFMSLMYDMPLIAHINVNWLAPVKIRRTIIGGSRRMVVFDDLDPSEKIKVYDRGIDVARTPEEVQKMLVSYRIGDMWAPNVEHEEALYSEVLHFSDCIRNGVKPITSGEVGLNVVRTLEAAGRSMRTYGRAIDIKTLQPKD